MHQFKIIGTGSDGNCFTFGPLMIDLGLSYTKVKSSLDDITHILLTHIHGDHFKPATIRKVFVNHENITFVCGEWLRDKLLDVGVDEDRILVVECGKVYDLGDYSISPVLAYHDVENCGYRIKLDDYLHFHITDTFSLDGIVALNYDSASIECNHEYDKALELIDEAKENDEFSHLQNAIKNHLAVHKTIEFCKRNSIKKLIPVHIGSSTKKEVVEALRRW